MDRRILAVFLVILASGCISANQVRRRSDLMSYLFPEGSVPPNPHPERARMQLPLRIGIAFVPSQGGSHRLFMEPVAFPTIKSQTIEGSSEEQLLGILRNAFQERDWVSQIVVIHRVT